ncbi:MAG: group 1 glycosyl transferase [Microgenomates group bacterium Gr01-1014_5]|nr:MAG: group 1 glycosyl transferase [Microgenomates group bacterium Gr01-1014_5]
MINLYFDTKPLSSGHVVRGIGYYTKNLFEQLQEDKSIRLVENTSEADIIHHPYFDLFTNTLKPVAGKKNVVTIFDVIPLLYPQNYPPGVKGMINLFRQKLVLKKVDSVITISETSKKDIVRYLDVPAKKIFPIHLAASHEFRKLATGNWQLETTRRFGLPEHFVLYVGDVNFNKNLVTLADACCKANIPLVVVGKQATNLEIDLNHIENRSFAELLKKYGKNKNVLKIGYVPTEDLVKIYNLAAVYCQPSLYEGFGIPVLEAQACGVPVIASRTQALVEIAESSCLFVDNPKDSNELGSKIAQIIKDETFKERLVAEGVKNVKQYSWEKTRDKTVEVYKSC